METGNLTPKSNNTVANMRFTGEFGQPGGFGSVLGVRLNNAGHVDFNICSRGWNDDKEKSCHCNLNNEQRKALIKMLSSHEPVLYENAKSQV